MGTSVTPRTVTDSHSSRLGIHPEGDARGIGFQVGQLRPEIGEGFAQLQCSDCGATWTGPPGEACEYCAPDAHDRRMATEHRRLELVQRLDREERQRIFIERDAL